jgi:hypothetical protein
MEHSAVLAAPATPVRGRAALFVATILTGSFLLFLVQPMVARMALPRLGGAPAVWNSAMLVYQALLLGGYAWAHALGRLSPRRQALAHLALFGAAALWLPIGLAGFEPPAGVSPALWAPWLFAASIGPLFLAVAAQAPLMQRWFGEAVPGANPYPLYAASNLGSFGGLVAYPFVVEPLFPVAGQSLVWSVGYGLLGALVVACALALPARRAPAAEAARQLSAALPPPSFARRGRWLLLSAVPSGLMLSTTTHLTTDILAMPLLWVAPLSLYLLSFSVAFRDGGRLAATIARTLPVLLVVAAALVFSSGAAGSLVPALVDVALLFAAAVVLHRALYRSRPEPARLTGFYLHMSLGGVLGGVFCALVAPLVFDWAYEQPILMLAVALLAPPRPVALAVGRWWRAGSGRLGRWLPAGALVASIAVGGFYGVVPDATRWLVLAIVAAAALAAAHRPRPFALLAAALALANGGWATLVQSTMLDIRWRSYFGVSTVGEDAAGHRVLVHGTTVHGVQLTAPGHELDPTSYYAPPSGAGRAFAAVPRLYPRASVAVVGLGAGALACYAQPGQRWRFFEIDPTVIAIARDPSRFTFLSRCTPGAPVELGDARMRLAAGPARAYDVLVADAFSSDAMPMHLLTTEGFGVYERALKPGGLLLVNISNRFFDLQPVIAAAARRRGLTGVVRDWAPTPAERRAGATRSIWVALARDPKVLAEVEAGGGWRPLAADPGFEAWTDDYATILPLVRGWLTGRRPGAASPR